MVETVDNEIYYESKYKKIQRYIQQFDRKNKINANILTITFVSLFLIYVVFQDAQNKDIVIANTIITFCIFIIMAIGLNLHTGQAGMVNFGVIFFVGIGAVSTGLLNSKYGIDPWIAIFVGVAIASIFGYLISFPTIRLRGDYFAIVTIALGEILRVSLNVLKQLRSRTEESGISSPGIANIEGPHKGWFQNNIGFESLNQIQILAIISVTLVIIIFLLAQLIAYSPFGRVLRTIREDDEVVESYGYNVFRYKSITLALGAGMMAVAGGLWAWKLESIFADFMLPASSTFLVWAAFVLGGKGNNKGMLVGASVVVFIENYSRTITPPISGSLSTCTDKSGFFICSLDKVYRFVIIDVGGFLFGESSYTNRLQNENNLHVNVNFLRLIVIGMIIILSSRYFSEGLIPEPPYRPEVIYERQIKNFESIITCSNCNETNPLNELICRHCGNKLSENKGEDSS